MSGLVLRLCVLGAVLPGLAAPHAWATEGCPARHEVVRGDTLVSIARQYFGDAGAFRQIEAANGAAALGALEPGMVLAIPCPGDAVEGGAWQVLIGVAELDLLAATAPGVQVVDIRSARTEARGFVPGAVRIPIADWRGALSPAPDAARLARLLGRAGIDPSAALVIMAEDGGIESLDQAAWVYWALKTAGASRVAILAPGFEGWRDAGNRPARRPDRLTSRQVALEIDLRWTAGAEEIAGIVAGTVPGTVMAGGVEALPQAGVADGDPRGWAEDVLDELKARPVAWETGPVVTLPADGLSGAAAWFYASEVAGIRDVRLALP